MNRIYVLIVIFVFYEYQISSTYGKQDKANKVWRSAVNDAAKNNTNNNKANTTANNTKPYQSHDTMHINNGPLNVELINTSYTGFDHANVSNPKINYENHTLEVTMAYPDMVWRQRYSAVIDYRNGTKGRITDTGDLMWQFGPMRMAFRFETIENPNGHYINLTDHDHDIRFGNYGVQSRMGQLDTDPLYRDAWGDTMRNMVYDNNVRNNFAKQHANIWNRRLNTMPVEEVFLFE